MTILILLHPVSLSFHPTVACIHGRPPLESPPFSDFRLHGSEVQHCAFSGFLKLLFPA
jgi:hypothetical protein